MLKVSQAPSNAFHNLKCGEIFCISSAVYNVTCCLCATKMHLDQFPSHFQMQHLTLDEESISLEELDRKRRAKLFKNKKSLLDNGAIKEEDPEDDPIKQEEFVEENDDDKSLQQILRDSEKAKSNAKIEQDDLLMEPYHDLNIGDKLEVQIEVEKPNTRSSRRSRINKEEEGKKQEEVKLQELSFRNVEESSCEIMLDLNKDDEWKEEYSSDDDDVEMDRDWLLEDKRTTPHAEAEDKDNPKDEIAYFCHTCKRSYASKRSLQKHNYAVHNKRKKAPHSEADDKGNPKDEIEYFCHTCKRPYASKRSLQKHNYAVHNKRKTPHSEVDDKGNPKDDIAYFCDICKRTYASKRSLNKHIWSVHNPNRPPRKYIRVSKTDHKCVICSERFGSSRDLLEHKYKHSGIFCDICGKPFTQNCNMVRHRIRHTGIKEFKCKDCDKEFFTDKELKSHIICHTGRMPVICEICGKQCRERGVLTAHMRRHTGERPAKCDVCGKSFFSFHDLNIHAVTHSSDRPFRCDICGSTFQRRKALRVHKLIHSKDRKHVCKICGKGFAQSSGLNSHLRTHDAALEKSINETVQQPLGLVMLDSSSSYNESHIILSTPISKIVNISEVSMPPENSMLGQYIV